MSLKSVFKNLNDVNSVLPELLSVNVHNMMELDWVLWLKSAPKFSTFRVNTVRVSPKDVVDFLTERLDETAKSRGKERPLVAVHNLLPDCVVVSPWKNVNLTCKSKEVIVDKYCGQAVLRGSPVFAPGVKGMTYDVLEGTEVSVYVDVSNKCTKGFTREFIDESKVFVGNGIIKLDRFSLFNQGQLAYGTAVEMTDTISQVCGVKLAPDLGILQNLPSIVCGHVLKVDGCDSLTVLDMCAAPGNKTTHIAALMENKGLVIAIDKTNSKIEKINDLCQRLSIDNVRAFPFNSIDSIDATRQGNKLTDGPPFPAESFDRVLLDAPCSGLGQRPLFDHNITMKELRSFPNLQKQLFATAVQHVRVGGFLVYSTCTITLGENEGLVKWALEKFPQLKLVPAEPRIGYPSTIESGLSVEECQMVQKFGPPALETPEKDTIGFFIAKFQKISSVATDL